MSTQRGAFSTADGQGGSVSRREVLHLAGVGSAAALLASRGGGNDDAASDLADVPGGGPRSSGAPMVPDGYLDVTAPPYNAVPDDDSHDDTAAIQTAIRDAYNAGQNEDLPNHGGKAVFLPPGTYLISNTLRGFEHSEPEPGAPDTQVKNHVIIGSAEQRPVLKINPNSTAFNNGNDPRPVLIFRHFTRTDPAATWQGPPHPLGVPDGYRIQSNVQFEDEVRNIDFDLSGKAGAIGLALTTAQDSSIENVRIKATGAHAGLWGLPGRDSVTANIVVTGGKYGFIVPPQPGVGTAGAVITGARFFDQTVSAIWSEDFVPVTFVGVRIRSGSVAPLQVNSTRPQLAWGAVTMVDGILEVTGSAVAVDNTNGKCIYLRNVYVTGTNDLIDSKGKGVVMGSGTWNLINEYSYNDQEAQGEGELEFSVHSMVEGMVAHVPVPVQNISKDVPAPPLDLIGRHVTRWINLEQYNGQDDGTIDVTSPPYSATPGVGSDNQAAIQNAIDDASDAGHGRVFIPRGVFEISDTLTLHSNTVLMGVARRVSIIRPHGSWKPVSVEYLIETDAAATATTFLGYVSLHAKTRFGEGPPGNNLPFPHDWFGAIDWKAGTGSSIAAISFELEGHHQTIPTNARALYRFTGPAGGQHYGLRRHGRLGMNPDYRPVSIEGTSTPLSFYGLNLEMSKSAGQLDGYDPDNPGITTNLEIKDAQNVRIFGMKREGAGASVVVNNSENIAVFSSGAMRHPATEANEGYMEIYGTSNNIVMANLIVQLANQGPDGTAMLVEALDGAPEVRIDWPDGVSVYKRGNFNNDEF